MPMPTMVGPISLFADGKFLGYVEYFGVAKAKPQRYRNRPRISTVDAAAKQSPKAVGRLVSWVTFGCNDGGPGCFATAQAATKSEARAEWKRIYKRAVPRGMAFSRVHSMEGQYDGGES